MLCFSKIYPYISGGQKKKNHVLTTSIGCSFALFSKIIFFNFFILFNPFTTVRICILPSGCSVSQSEFVRASPLKLLYQTNTFGAPICIMSMPTGFSPLRMAVPQQRQQVWLNQFLQQQWYLLRSSTEYVTDIKNYNRHMCKICICIALMVTFIYMSIYIYTCPDKKKNQKCRYTLQFLMAFKASYRFNSTTRPFLNVPLKNEHS